MWFMHDGAPPHFPRTVRQRLNQTSGEWTGRGGPVNWPGRSPNLNSPNFWLWRHLKTSACLLPINDLELLEQKAENAYQEI
jgi:hypothetical protein